MIDWITHQVFHFNVLMFVGILGVSHFYNKKLIEDHTDAIKDTIRDNRRN